MSTFLDTGPKGTPSHAFKLGQSHDSSTFDALISISGDGIVHELLNGLAFHSSGKGRKALRESPIVHIPCGSGNALATSIVGNEKVGDWRYCTLVGLKGKEKKIDLCSVTQKGGKRTLSFLTQAFGLMADLGAYYTISLSLAIVDKGMPEKLNENRTMWKYRFRN